MESVLEQNPLTKISLPNKNKGSKDYNKKINLKKLYNTIDQTKNLQTHLEPNYDTEINPKQNYLGIKLTGNIRLYSNGTVTTNFPIPQDALLLFLDKFYKAYVRDCLE